MIVLLSEQVALPNLATSSFGADGHSALVAEMNAAVQSLMDQPATALSAGLGVDVTGSTPIFVTRGASILLPLDPAAALSVDNSKSAAMSAGTVIGIVCGVLAALTIVAVVVMCYKRSRRGKQHTHLIEHVFNGGGFRARIEHHPRSPDDDAGRQGAHRSKIAQIGGKGGQLRQTHISSVHHGGSAVWAQI